MKEHAPDIALSTEDIDRDLQNIATGVIRRYLDMSDPANRAFLASPDGRQHHQTEWHQWGILTHTRVFLRHFDEDIPRLLREWGVWELVERWLERPIDGVPRWDLLRVSILLHDIGKFGARKHGRDRYHFARHEELSGHIIRRELDLAGYGLTPAQIEYIAHTAEDHFVLGHLRKRSRDLGRYDERFVESAEFERLAHDIKRHHPDDYVEVGVLFLGDSLAKADRATGPPRAVSQYDINVAVARRYLQIVQKEPSL
ncbi:MAG TPA: hypothetical protein VF221_02520 [Chloroflexota bacterium]